MNLQKAALKLGLSACRDRIRKCFTMNQYNKIKAESGSKAAKPPLPRQNRLGKSLLTTWSQTTLQQILCIQKNSTSLPLVIWTATTFLMHAAASRRHRDRPVPISTTLLGRHLWSYPRNGTGYRRTWQSQSLFAAAVSVHAIRTFELARNSSNPNTSHWTSLAKSTRHCRLRAVDARSGLFNDTSVWWTPPSVDPFVNSSCDWVGIYLLNHSLIVRNYLEHEREFIYEWIQHEKIGQQIAAKRKEKSDPKQLGRPVTCQLSGGQ